MNHSCVLSALPRNWNSKNLQLNKEYFQKRVNVMRSPNDPKKMFFQM